MKGIIDLFLACFFLVILGVFLLVGPEILKARIQANYVFTLQPLTSTNVLLSTLSSTSLDNLAGNKKSTLEIIGEKLVLPKNNNLNIDFLKTNLDNLAKIKPICYFMEGGAIKLADKSCADIVKKIQDAIPMKISVPYSPDKLVENLKFVIK